MAGKKQNKENYQTECCSLINRFRNDPLLFIENDNFLGIKTWSGMRLIIDTVWKNQKTSVRACHGVSKTMTAAVIAVTFFNLWNDCIVITTAPTERQIKKLLWKEINNIYSIKKTMKSGLQLRGECTTMGVTVEENKLAYMYGFSTNNQSSAEGVHASNLLWIIDEAKGSPEWLYDSIEGSLTGENCKVLELSTTDGTDQQCNFRIHHGRRNEWNCIHISAFDSPFVDIDKYNDDEIKKYRNEKLFEYGKPKHGREWNLSLMKDAALTDEGWIKDKKKTWYVRDRYLWDTKVCGEFSELTEDNLIPLAWVESAINAEVSEHDHPVYGLDVARYGVDHDVLTKKKGHAVKWQEVWGKTDIMTTVGKVINFIDEEGAVSVDIIGVGAGAHDRFAELVQNGECRKIKIVIGVDSSQKSENEIDNRQFHNYRAELFWKLRCLFEEQYNKGDSISIPDIPELIEELTSIRYAYHSSGKILIEPTEKVKERIGRSPDRACSLAYSCVVVPVDIDNNDDVESFVNGL